VALTPVTFQLHVQLDEVRPSIWRRLLTPSDIPMSRLSEVLQIVMGWRNAHLHQFLVGGATYGTHEEDRE
jgi:hypothetical protein